MKKRTQVIVAILVVMAGAVTVAYAQGSDGAKKYCKAVDTQILCKDSGTQECIISGDCQAQ
jgi:hypothetical protein